MPRPALLLLCLAALAFTLPAPAQVTTATLYGSVADPSGASIPQASVTLLHEQTGVSRKASSDDRGEFTVNFLPIGRYTIEIQAPGFKSLKEQGFEMAASGVYRRTFPLEVGALSDSVTVTAESPLINAGNPAQQQTHTSLEIRELPVSRRDWSNLISVGTAVSVTGGEYGGRVIMNGLPEAGFTLTVDGTNAQGDPETPNLGLGRAFGNLIRTISLEAISEVSVSKGIYPAEFNTAMAGNVNVITRSGTNEYHGSLFENYQSQAMNARNQFLATKVPLVFNQFGGSIGGPIQRNKLFFFSVFEGYRLSQQQRVTGNVPTEAFRNRMTAAVPAYKQFFDLNPLPTRPNPGTDITGFYEGVGSQRMRDNHAVVRGDYYLNSTNLFTARYTRGRPYRMIPAISVQNTRLFNGLAEVGTATFTHTRPTWSSETRFGHNKNDLTRIDGIYTLGIPGIVGDLGFGFAGETLFLGGTDTSIEEVVAWTRGRHSMKFGGIFGWRRISRENIEAPEIRYASEADMRANIPSRVRVTFGVRDFLMTQVQSGFFFQDDFKMNARLTLNLGLRWDYFTVPKERDGRLFNRDGPYGPLRASDSVFNADWNNFSPRLGFAWALDGSGKTVLRGGTGYFHNRHSLEVYSQDLVQNAADEPNRSEFARLDAQRLGLRYPVFNKDVLPLVKGSLDTIYGSAFDPNFVYPYSLQWTLGVQRQLTSNMAIETAYVANRGIKIPLPMELNAVDRITGLRPNPRFAPFRYYSNVDSSVFNSWQTTLRSRFAKGFNANVHYTYGYNLGYGANTLGVSEASPQNINDIRSDRGPTGNYLRHRFVSDFLYELPLMRFQQGGGRASKLLLEGWQFAGIVRSQTGGPIGVTQSSALKGSRPDYVGGEAVFGDYRETLVYFDRSVFRAVPIVRASGAPERPGNLGRNALLGPGSWSVDLALSKNLALTERFRLQVRADLFNALNHTNYGGPSSNLNAGNFGRITGTQGARTMQLNARLSF